MKYKVINKVTGEEVKLPAKLKDFRGDETLVESVSRMPSGPSEGRVSTEHGEYYPNVFGLKIVVEEA